MHEVAVLLHNIRSAHNVGSIFRTSDAAGVRTMYLSGYTPTPVDRFGRVQKDIAKTALTAERTVAWRYEADPFALIERLRGEGWKIVGVEQDARAVDYRAYQLEMKTLLILGTEVEGMAPELRDACDVLLEIPMHGAKESLNVSVAAGIALFRLRD